MSRLSSGVRHAAAAWLVLALFGTAACTSQAAQSPSGSASKAPTASSSAAPTPNVTLSLPTEGPTPTAEPTAEGLVAGSLLAACGNTPAPLAAAYSKGRSHPLVVVDDATSGWRTMGGYDINSKWTGGLWPTPIELVLCVGADKTKSAGSCGLYKRGSDGKIGSVVKTRHTVTVTVIVAQTGKRLQTKVLLGPIPNCDASEMVSSGNPPWPIYGSLVSTEAINSYAEAVSRQLSK
jgi:hypothetical protein